MIDSYKFKKEQPLTDQIKNILEEYIDTIQKNDWDKFYQELDFDQSTFGEVTQLLIESGIDPLDNITYVPENYLYNNWEILNISLPNNIDTIQSAAFEGCDNLESISLPDNLKIIDARVFHSCSDLKSITLPKTLEYLGSGNFDYCDSLETVDFEGSCEQFLALIKDKIDIFNYCDKLENVSCNDGFISIDIIRHLAD